MTDRATPYISAVSGSFGGVEVVELLVRLEHSDPGSRPSLVLGEGGSWMLRRRESEQVGHLAVE